MQQRERLVHSTPTVEIKPFRNSVDWQLIINPMALKIFNLPFYTFCWFIHQLLLWHDKQWHHFRCTWSISRLSANRAQSVKCFCVVMFVKFPPHTLEQNMAVVIVLYIRKSHVSHRPKVKTMLSLWLIKWWATKAYRGIEVSLNVRYYWPRRWMAVSGHLHAQTTVFTDKVRWI